MDRKTGARVATYGDAAVLVAYAVVLSVLLFDLPAVPDPTLGAGDDSTFVAVFLGAVLSLGAHALYVAWFLRRYTETAIERGVRPTATHFERGLTGRYVDRVLTYDDEAGARRASRHLTLWAVAMLALVVAGVTLVL